MKRLLCLAVIVAGTVLVGCDSPPQAKSPPEPAAQQTIVADKNLKAEDTKTVVPAAEQAPTVSDNVPNKGEQPITAPAPMAEETPKTVTSVAVEVVEASADTTDKEPWQTDTTAAGTNATAATTETARNAAIPQEIILKASNGNITFLHGKHADAYACKTCHGDSTPAAFGITKDIAHKLCKDCHKTAGSGPTACKDCHKK
jgi:hypothetical protein